MTCTSQPIIPSVIELKSPPNTDCVDILSPPPDKTDIVDAGQSVSFRINLQITGLGAVVSMYTNEPVQVKLHCELIETPGTRFTLGPFPFTTPGTVAALNAGFSFVTGPFTTSLNAGGGQFRTALNDDDGVYRVTTELHFTNGKANSMIDDRILVVTAP